MNNEKIIEIKKLLVGLAEYFGTTLSEPQKKMYSEDLEKYELKSLAEAIEKIRIDPKQEFFPRPAKIIEIMEGNRKDEALEAVGRIITAMGKFGSHNLEKSKAFIGELGWRVVDREGGWASLCQRTTDQDLPILKAQWRDMAVALQNRASAGRDNEAPKMLNTHKDAEVKKLT